MLRREPPNAPAPTVDEVVDELRGKIAIEGARLSYRQNCATMQRVHSSPAIGKRRVDGVTHHDVERLARAMLERGKATKTVRNVMTFLHSVFVLAMRNGWVTANPVVDATRPKRRRVGDANPDLQFLTLSELDAVVATVPEVVVDRDVFGPVLRVIILTAGTTGIRQSELLVERR
jgi:site-specific recombinase XerD